MSKTAREIEDLVAVRADFDSFVSAGDEIQARACVQTMGDMGEEFEAMKMHRECNRVFNHEPKEREQDSGYDNDRSYEGSYKDVY